MAVGIRAVELGRVLFLTSEKRTSGEFAVRSELLAGAHQKPDMTGRRSGECASSARKFGIRSFFPWLTHAIARFAHD